MVDALLPLLLRQAALLSFAVLLLAALRPWLLKRLGAGLTYAAWLLVPLLLLTPALPRPSHEPMRVWLEPTLNAAAQALPVVPPPATGLAWPALLLGGWLAGAVAVAVLQLRRQWRLPGQVLPAGSSPALVGLLRPRVLLPVDFTARFSPQQQALILAHEAVHRARGDNAWRLLACLLTALHWWNPLAWWGARLMQADQELACDAAVLAQRPDATAAYAQALLVAHDLHALSAPLASRWGSSHPLVERIAMLNRPLPLNTRRAALATVALLGTATLAWAAQTEGAPSQATRVDLRYELRVGEFHSTPRLITVLGTPATIEFDDGLGSGRWKLVVLVTQDADGSLRTRQQTSAGMPPAQVGDHTLVAASGQTSHMEISDGSGRKLELSRTVTLLPPDFKMPTQKSQPRS